ncbi:hypothetical protein [Blastococcus sp. SYSU DS0539]
MSWQWIIGGLVVWLVLATLLAFAIGRGIRIADRNEPGTGVPLTTADLPSSLVAPAARRRRAVPLPPIGVGLAAAAVGLMGTGFALRLSGATGAPARLLSMDAPFSLPRLFVAGLFAVAAVAAVAGAARNPGRRTFWLAVGLVAAGIASVKTGGTVHAEAMGAAISAVGEPAALAISVVVAVAVVGALFFLSRTERRDRRRVLGSLAGYGVASVGLSALSVLAPDSLRATATFLEESGEALAGVAFLVAVLIGVAPRLVLPADWALRRSADAHGLEAADMLPGRAAGSAR